MQHEFPRCLASLFDPPSTLKLTRRSGAQRCGCLRSFPRPHSRSTGTQDRPWSPSRLRGHQANARVPQSSQPVSRTENNTLKCIWKFRIILSSLLSPLHRLLYSIQTNQLKDTLFWIKPTLSRKLSNGIWTDPSHCEQLQTHRWVLIVRQTLLGSSVWWKQLHSIRGSEQVLQQLSLSR